MSRFARYNGHSFFTQLIVTFVTLIFVTAIAVGMPAYWIISNELEKQAWARIEDAERSTLVSLEAEQARLAGVALLAAQRPSLQQLLVAGDTAALSDYLQTFRSSLALDRLAVYDTSGHLLASSGLLSSQTEPAPQTAAGFYVVSEGGLALVAGQPIRDNRLETLLGYVTVSVQINSDFARQLAVKTGFEQSILISTARIATSLENAPPEAVKAALVERAARSGQSRKTELTMRGVRYYAILVPLQDEGPVLVEIIMPVETLIAARNRALLALALSAGIVATVGSLAGAWYARRLTAPLERLTQAAKEIGQGDMTAAIPVSGRPAEIATLAEALDESRIKIRGTLEELSRVKTWSETLIQSMIEGVITFDVDRRITFFSRGAARITDWTSEEASGQLISEVLNLPESETSQLISAAGGKRQVQITTRGSQRKTLAVTGAKVIPPDSDTEQTVLVLRDITDEEMGRRLHSYFLANITHEFRTPLSGLKASIELLLDETDYLSPDEIHELLNSIHLSVSGLQSLVDNLLESVNIEAGRFSIHRRPVDLNQIMAEAIRTMQPLLDRRKQWLSLIEPLQLPPVHADPTRLTQVMINLLANASKYSPQEKAIDLELGQMGESLKVTMADRGPGIPPNERANLFNRFVRLGAQTSEQYGIGLGLSVVKAIIEGHGGEVGVDERPGGGSVFWFTLPLVEKAGRDESSDC
jgi:PAS domain S-box-containing protein